jgi:hypothetical protein
MRTTGTAGRRQRRSLVTVGVVLATASQLAFSCQHPPACTMPYSPVGGDQDILGEPPSGTWPVPSSAVRRPIPPGDLDSDGDGVADTISFDDAQRTLVVHRTSGDLTLTVNAPTSMALYLPENLRAGDVDGDGRGDLVVNQLTRQPEYSTDRPPVIQHIVSGATPNGVHPLSTVAATLVPATEYPAVPRPLGDIDDDGHDDLATVAGGDETGPERWAIWRGTQLDLTAGASQPDPALHPPAGTLIGPVPLGSRNAVAISTGRTDDGFGLLLWVPEGGLAFTTAGALPVTRVSPLGGGSAPSQLQVADDGQDRWLIGTFWEPNAGQRWAWDLDDLCANTPPPP